MFEPLAEVGSDPLPWWMDVDQVDFDDYLDEPGGSSGELAEVAARPLGAWHLAGLANLDQDALSADERLTLTQQWERVAAWVTGNLAASTAETFDALTAHANVDDADPTPFLSAAMTASAEIAAALRVAPRTADNRIRQALDLAGPTVALRDAMTAGRISAAHVSAISRELDRLPAAGNPALAEDFANQCAQVLATVVPFAVTHTPGECARKTRMLVSAIDPAAVRERRREVAERKHGVYLLPTEPGTCEITAVMPLAHGHALMNAVDTLAGDDRFEVADGCITIGQRRVAAMVALMLGDPGSVGRVDGPVAEAKITAHINVVVPLPTMITANGQGGTIAGEAVPADALAEMLSELAPTSTLRRLVTDEAGCILDAGRTRYAISDAQRRFIELRDVHCRFPGCTQPACKCDVDHAISYANGGCTDINNCGALCRKHHQLKTHGRWRITASHRNGRCTWRSPLGRIYEHTPPDLLPPPPSLAMADDGPPPF